MKTVWFVRRKKKFWQNIFWPICILANILARFCIARLTIDLHTKKQKEIHAQKAFKQRQVGSLISLKASRFVPIPTKDFISFRSIWFHRLSELKCLAVKPSLWPYGIGYTYTHHTTYLFTKKKSKFTEYLNTEYWIPNNYSTLRLTFSVYSFVLWSNKLWNYRS